jgi:hypothetical protein
MAFLNVKLSDIEGDLVLTIGVPEYMADERYTYFLQYKPNPLSSDTAELTIDPQTNLLQTVNGTAEDKTSQIIVQLAKAAAMIAQAEAGAEIVIFERKIDPADDKVAVPALVSDMNTFATGHATRMYAKNNCTDDNKTDKCVSYRTWKSGTPISFVVRKPLALNVEPADCSLGVCYRAPAPYHIEFAFNGQYAYGTVVNLPNERPVLVLPLERTAFVKRVDNVEFEHGMLKKVHFEKPSEALEVASLPVTVMTSIFTSISTLIQAKIDLSDKEKGLAQAQTALLQAQKDLQDKRVAVAQAAAARQPGVLLSGSSSGQRSAPKLGSIPIPQPAAPGGLGGLPTSPSNPGELPSGGR